MDADAWDRRHERGESPFGSVPDAAVVEHVAALAAGRALDLGCGTGRHTLWLALRAWEVTAVDFSTAALTRAVRSAAALPRASRDRVTWVHADVTDLAVPQAYDLVLACHLQLSAESRRRVLSRAATALRPGGTLLALEPERSPSITDSGCTPEELANDLAGHLTITTATLTLADHPGRDGDPASDADPRQALVVGFRGPVGT
ncbi:class I SAM-dependent methyltransferase [Rhodococcus sp. NPDC058532]|uniref:class I SAM-dependent methyltransferase n=1 Tax=Rhodococcus sp. NPDC058532 TaxID=3346540 RepID=UPI0036689A22